MHTMQNLMLGTAIGGATGLTFMVGEVIISGGTQLGIRDAITIGVFCCGVVMWMSRKFQRIDDRLESVEKSIEELPCPGKVCDTKKPK